MHPRGCRVGETLAYKARPSRRRTSFCQPCLDWSERDLSELEFWIVYWSSDGSNVCRVHVASRQHTVANFDPPDNISTAKPETAHVWR